jgi:hypothetical protein
MDKETFIKKLSIILEDFDSDRETDMKYCLDNIYLESVIYFSDIIKKERENAIKEFLVEQLKHIKS